ncbi:MAG: alpha/beta fold hydrolase [Pseudolabrys sp.]|nr:alpha/beta fold hydrolase [Pseudolabrys sp.]MDP2293857.1 alpha/beta fold hydrolase [Pseudolabrys sp.]
MTEPVPPDLTTVADSIDRTVHATAARFTMGLSPSALAEAYFDWASHLAFSPGTRLKLANKAARKSSRFLNYAWQCATDGAKPCIEPLPQDRRFAAPEWQNFPFNFMSQAFLLQQQWWHNATTGIPGVSKRHENIVAFAARQLLDVFSPSNFPLTNPEVLKKTVDTGGLNLVSGLRNFAEDRERTARGEKPAGTGAFVVGRDVATTPGKVIYRNRLIELIQYAPTTAEVRPEPILIVPAWIMKYYILDLSPQNSLVKYLTGQGFTVFMISWKNPVAEDRDLSLDDYRTLGVMSALDAVSSVIPKQKVHAVGYCLGGTLLSIAAATMARDNDDRLKSITLLAAQVDFMEAGELMLFINESQLAFLDDLMAQQGYLDSTQMAGAFQLLRSNDLVWSRMVRDYLMDERTPMSDLMAWNADTTRLPYRMHSEYLRQLFLHNDLAEGRLSVAGKPIVLTDIRAPIFSVGTVHDHVAPWRSTYKINLLSDVDVTYLLTSGGHNVGIVSEPGHKRHHFQVATKKADDLYVDPDAFAAAAPHKDGSWWPEWAGWLEERSGAPTVPPPMGGPTSAYAPICDAPGTYVFQQ